MAVFATKGQTVNVTRFRQHLKTLNWIWCLFLSLTTEMTPLNNLTSHISHLIRSWLTGWRDFCSCSNQQPCYMIRTDFDQNRHHAFHIENRNQCLIFYQFLIIIRLGCYSIKMLKICTCSSFSSVKVFCYILLHIVTN